MRLFNLIKAVNLSAVVISMALVSCGRPFDVNVGTDEPIKVDVSMEVHVYQHDEDSPEDKVKRQDYKNVLEQRRGRMEEVQKLKNNRLVGEDHQGLLSIRNLPAGEYGLYVKKTVKEENSDRNFLMKTEAEQKGAALGDVKKAQWSHWQRKSFPGEWIQVEGDEPGSYRWEQKKGVSEDKGEVGAKTGAQLGASKAAAVGTAKGETPPKK